MSSSSTTFQLRVPGRPEYNVAVSVSSRACGSATVGDLKEHVASLYALPAPQLRFILRGAQLLDMERQLSTLPSATSEGDTVIYVAMAKTAQRLLDHVAAIHKLEALVGKA